MTTILCACEQEKTLVFDTTLYYWRWYCQHTGSWMYQFFPGQYSILEIDTKGEGNQALYLCKESAKRSKRE